MSYYRDVLTIVESKEFRKLQDKTQLFNPNNEKMFRTRLTHTIEVCTTALAIAEHLKSKGISPINNSLVTAIALAHDIGHTPFGHVGERVIKNILDGSDDLDGLINAEKFNPICFKHNINSFKILTSKQFLEDKSLSWKVLDGALKHTKVYKSAKEYERLSDDRRSDPYDLKVKLNVRCSEFTDETLYDLFDCDNKDYQKLNLPLTIEGQIVAISDEIAQRVADFQDIYNSGKKFSISKLIQDLKYTRFYKKNKSQFLSLKNKETLIDNVNERLREFLISTVVYDELKESELKDDYAILSKYDDICGIKYVHFDTYGKAVNKVFEDFIESIVSTGGVRVCDEESTLKLRTLFKYYYSNIEKLDQYGFNDLFDDIIKYGKTLYLDDLHVNNISNEQKIKVLQIFINCFSEKIFINQAKVKLRELKLVDCEDFFIKLCDKQNLKQLHSIILLNIGNYIAGMTDSNATFQYNSIKYLVE